MTDITPLNAHRYVFPHQEVASALIMAHDAALTGHIQAYHNLKSGGLMLSYVCSGCATHHPLLEVHMMSESELAEGLEGRFLMVSDTNVPADFFLDLTGGVLVVLDEPFRPARDTIDRLRKGGRQRTLDISLLGTLLPVLHEAARLGDLVYAFDLNTGMTVVCFATEKEVCPAFCVDMPKFPDMRSAAGYVALGNPFRDVPEGRLSS